MLSAGETPVVHRQFKIDNYKKKKLHMGVFLSGFLCSVVRTRLKRTPPMEMGLLKPRERDPESEDEIL